MQRKPMKVLAHEHASVHHGWWYYEDIQPFSSRQIVLADRRIARAHVTVWMDSQDADLFVRNLSMFLRVVVDDSNPRLFTIRCGEPNCANLAYPVQ